MNLKLIQYSALLHDIGKFYQRSQTNWNSKNHSKWGYEFVKEYWNDDISNLVRHHHNSNDSISKILQITDRHSAPMDKGENEDQEKYNEHLISIFSNISLTNENHDNYNVPLNELDLNNFDDLKPINKRISNNTYNLTQKYKILWNKFIDDLDKIGNKYDFNTLLALLKKYTSTMPYELSKSKTDISLFDHLKTTVALASCKYWHEKQGNAIIKNGESSKNQDNLYLLIGGDISGIQKFIFKISSPDNAQKGMSKRLRGRSLYLSLLTRAISEKIIKDLKLTSANILFCGGGRFTIIAQNTEDVKNKLDKLKLKLNTFFIEDFNAELYMALSYLPCSDEDLEDFALLNEKLLYYLSIDKKHKFSDYIKNTNNIEKFFNEKEDTHHKEEDFCPVCGELKKNKDDDFCLKCQNHRRLAQDSSNAEYMVKCFSKEKDKEFNFFESELSVGFIFKTKLTVGDIKKYDEKYESVEVIKLNDSNFLDIIKDTNEKFTNVSFSFDVLGNNIPLVDIDNKTIPFYFEHLAKLSKGSDKLGVLKMDVDNLGLIFSLGLDYLKDKNDNKTKAISNISRTSTLSFYLDLFVSGFINEISKNKEYMVYKYDDLCDECKENLKDLRVEKLIFDENENERFEVEIYCDDNKKPCSKCVKNGISTIYIDYSGGDDLLVIGPYDNIIKFAGELREKFKKWTSNNPDITISAGINIVSPKFPIGKAVQGAESLLKRSKNYGRNRVTVFNETVEWENNGSYKDFHDLMKFSEDLEYLISKEIISTGFVYSMLQLWYKYFQKGTQESIESEDFDKIYRIRITNKRYVPKLVYNMRNINDEKIRTKFRKKHWNMLPWIKIPASWISLRRR
ncbi:MAG: type III-A CRISPR-associated protein Cas10/Csm1 [Methanobrevibacter sp.]|jgi:CRISPR-associated protein Csm1|nr:type III-A CRISPR-associated protein Cas10/Csm1 [Candidatus Methanoflexus mossambicus]